MLLVHAVRFYINNKQNTKIYFLIFNNIYNTQTLSHPKELKMVSKN